MSTTHTTRIKLVPGLKGGGLFSLEPIGATGCYLRHQKFVLYLDARPRRASSLYEADSSFKVVRLDGGKVRFEASNYPGFFLTAMDNGTVHLVKGPPPVQSTFYLME